MESVESMESMRAMPHFHKQCTADAGPEQARGLQSPVSSPGISVLTPRLETLLTLRNPAFQGISDGSSILLTWQT